MRGVQTMTFAVLLCAVLSGEVPPRTDGGEETNAIPMLMVDEGRRLSTNSTGLEPGAVVAISLGSVAGAIACIGFLYWAWSAYKAPSSGSYQSMGYQKPAPFTPGGGFAFGNVLPGSSSDSTESHTDIPLLRISTVAQQGRRS